MIFAGSRRDLVVTAAILLSAYAVCCIRPSETVRASSAPVERGRLVYVAESCARCHAQDGNAVSQALINPRQGPDLAHVGARRSALWLKMHLYNPREVTGSSIMPSYAILFRDRRGNELVAYLSSLGASADQQHSGEQQWRLSDEFLATATPPDGPQLYNLYCATCHNANGRTRLRWQSEFIESPAILVARGISNGAIEERAIANPEPSRVDHLAQIIKFGIPASDMAGHERLSDKDIASLSLWLARNMARPVQ